MGCLVGPDSEKLQKRYPHVDVFMRPQQFKPLFDLINTLEEIDIDGCLSTLSPVNPSVTAFVPIVIGAIVAAPLGVKTAHRVAAAKLKRMFAVLLVFVSLRMIFTALI